jgi:hypothetical protein
LKVCREQGIYRYFGGVKDGVSKVGSLTSRQLVERLINNADVGEAEEIHKNFNQSDQDISSKNIS